MIGAANVQICLKALYSSPGHCRCDRCRPEIQSPPSGALAKAPDTAAADRAHSPLSGAVGGLFAKEK
jgi:hypothetical protein